MIKTEPRSEIVKKDFCVQPKNIDTEKFFYGAFDNNETEVSANWIVKLCQKMERWGPFSIEEIEKLYNKKGFRGFTFNRLIEPENRRNNPWSEWHLVGGGWIVEDKGLYYITQDFVVRCFKASPK